jgi:hypothetical protein
MPKKKSHEVANFTKNFRVKITALRGLWALVGEIKKCSFSQTNPCNFINFFIRNFIA